MAQKYSNNNNSLLYLAILAFALIMLPLLVDVIQQKAYLQGAQAATVSTFKQY